MEKGRQSGERFWRKHGVIYEPRNHGPWNRSHAQLPTLDCRDDVVRVYYATRDRKNRSLPGFFEVSINEPGKLRRDHAKPVMELGELGAFDDSGVMPSWILEHNGNRYLYYIGWNLGGTVPYRNAIGLAVESGDDSFQRVYPGPIMDRTSSAPHFCACPCVLIDGGIFRMWYLACQGWEKQGGRIEPVYDIRHAQSTDGFEWQRDETPCVALLPGEGGLARPFVIRTGDGYRMWFSARGRSGFREDPSRGYRIIHARSRDGLSWKRTDELCLEPSPAGWDSQMAAYPAVLRRENQWLMFYNGNGFGRSGIGWASTGPKG
jgi:hypothetical protein